ncbi:MAG TPA: hypothetical protein VFG43_08120 [Geminicoccaceae bacterium]|nr:hypothetical protein [Geminicoccaceae bacterium]
MLVNSRLLTTACCLLLPVLVPTQAALGQAPPTPLAGAPAAEERLPDGSSWPAPSYERPPPGLLLQSRTLGASPSATVAFGAAALVQPDLPPGLTLGSPDATRVRMGGEPETVERFGAMAPPAARETDGIDPEQREEMAGEQEEPAAETLQPEDRQGAAPAGRSKWFVTYPLEFEGVPVAKYSDVMSVIDGNGELLYVRKRNLPEEVDATTPTVPPEAAVAAALADAGEALGENPEQGTPELEIWVERDLDGRLAWTFTLTSPSLVEPAARQYWVAAVGEPVVLHWESLIHHTHQGHVTATIWEASPLGATGSRPIPLMRIQRSTGGDAVTNSDGLYSFTTGSGSAVLQSNLAGPHAVVQNQAGATMSASRTGTPASAIDLNFGAGGEFELAQTSAFYWTNVAHELATSILLGTDLPALPTRVNIADSCNAFWNGSSINFFRAGGSCPNTAYSDVVLHEYGHGVDARKGGILDGGYSEGFGDALAVIATRQPCLGRDFLGAGTCLRRASDVITWPPAGGEGVHAIGRRYAGFTWELITQLRKRYSDDESFAVAAELVLAAAAANPSNIPDAVRLSFIADDDDGNLTNGSPHFAELAAAADSRNIPRPADPIKGRKGFVWANNPTAASYTPSATYAHNDSGGAVTITRSASGTYLVRFAGLGANGPAGGHVQVTGYGSDNRECKIVGWGSAAVDFTVNVRCFDAAGAAADSRFTALVLWP